MKQGLFQFDYQYGGKTARVEQIRGTFIHKDDGKVSISIFNSAYLSPAQRYQAKAGVNKIIANDYQPIESTHCVLYNVTEKTNDTGLYELLLEKTKEVHDEYIANTRKWAVKTWAAMKQFLATPWVEQATRFGFTIKEYKDFSGKISLSPSYTKGWYKYKNKFDGMMRQMENGYKSFEDQQVKWAEIHYSDCTKKLVYRLNEKGVVMGAALKVTTARVGVNLEINIVCGDVRVHAWTIIAEGPVQRAHYRYLVK